MTLIEDKKSLLQRLFCGAKKDKGKTFHSDTELSGRYFYCTGSMVPEVLVEWIKEFLTENFDSTGVNWLYLVYPVVGIFLTGLFIRHIVKDDISMV